CKRGYRSPEWHRCTEDGDVTVVPRHDGRLSALSQCKHQPVRIDRRDFEIVCVVLRAASNVVHATVTVTRINRELLPALTREGAFGRKDTDTRHGRIGWMAIRHARRNPTPYQLVFVRCRVELAPAAVSDGARRLQQEQAGLWGRWKDTAAARFL